MRKLGSLLEATKKVINDTNNRDDYTHESRIIQQTVTDRWNKTPSDFIGTKKIGDDYVKQKYVLRYLVKNNKVCGEVLVPEGQEIINIGYKWDHNHKYRRAVRKDLEVYEWIKPEEKI